MGIVVVISATAVAMFLLVAFGHRLFEENRTRQTRRRRAADAPSVAIEPAAPGAVVWRTLVGAVSE